MAVRYRILGPLEALVGEQPARLGGPRQRAVLAILLAHARETVPASRLIDELWGERPPETAANVLQGFVSDLRKALGQDAIATRGRGYAVVLEDGAFDLDSFECLAAEGSDALAAGHATEAAEALRAALALWRGPALADLAGEDAVRTVAARLDELRLAVLEKQIEADLACGRHGEVIGELRALIAEHPLRERLRAQLMLALYRCDRQVDALEAYRARARPSSTSSESSRAGRSRSSSARSSARTPGSTPPEPMRSQTHSRRWSARSSSSPSTKSASWVSWRSPSPWHGGRSTS